MLNKKKKRGFTLIELMAILFVISLGLIVAIGLISQIFSRAKLTSSSLTAAYLAQEGIEIVRNIRDTNWIKRQSWDTGIPQGDYEADYNDEVLSSYQGRYLKIDGGFYNYDSGKETKFKRKIKIGRAENEISILVSVTWSEKGQDQKVEAFEKLYKWR